MLVLRTLTAACLAVCAFGAFADESRTIHTSGIGTVTEIPDMAVISVGVTHQASDAADALSAVSRDVRAVLDTLEKAGIGSRDIATSSVTVQPVWSGRSQSPDGAPRITGFQAGNTLSVKVRDLDLLGGVLDAAVTDGANQFSGLRFGFQDPEPLHDRARAMAVRDAMRRAAQLAATAGVELGSVLRITEADAGPRPAFEMAGAARMSADVPVAPGEMGTTVHVQMVFAISD